MALTTWNGAFLVAAGAVVAACSRSQSSPPAESEAAAADPAALAASVVPPAGLRVTAVMIGRRIGQGNLITEPTFQFSPADTVHVSVATAGSGTGTLTAAWRAQSGAILQTTSEPARAAGQNTAFSLVQPKGLRPGTYKVIVFLDEDSVETKVFVVAK